jgi:hypothetical protein
MFILFSIITIIAARLAPATESVFLQSSITINDARNGQQLKLFILRAVPNDNFDLQVLVIHINCCTSLEYKLHSGTDSVIVGLTFQTSYSWF